MSETTKIAWCDSTVNFWSGCTKVSPGCANCYAEAQGKRFESFGKWGKDAPRKLHESAFKLARKLNKKPWVCNECGHSHTESGWCGFCRTQYLHRRRVLSLSLGDWLDHEVPVEWLARMLDTIRLCPDINFLLCTKRPQLWRQRLSTIADTLPLPEQSHFFITDWLNGKAPKNVWIIASAEDQERLHQRVPSLLEIPAVVHAISAEPLLGPIRLDLQKNQRDQPECKWESPLPYLDWVIVGGESGRNARPCNVEWIRSIKDQCAAAGVPCFVKQLGSNPHRRGGEDESETRMALEHPKGGDPAEWPEVLRVQQWPKGAL